MERPFMNFVIARSPIGRASQIHTTRELRPQIHATCDSNIREWVQPMANPHV